MGGPPVVIVETEGFPVTLAEGAVPFTPVEVTIGGLAIVLVESGGFPMSLVNGDGTPWEPEEEEE